MDPTVFVALMTAVLGAGGIGSIVAFRKAGSEIESTSVATMREVIEELRNEVIRLRDENGRLRQSIDKLEAAALENRELKRRIARLEAHDQLQ